MIKANKIFFDLYSTSGGRMPYEEYRKWYDKNDTVYIALLDAQIYTKVARKEMFDKSMHHGCFIEHYSYETPEQVKKSAMRFVEENNLHYCEPDVFIKVEKENENSRVVKAFCEAERMIRYG